MVKSFAVPLMILLPACQLVSETKKTMNLPSHLPIAPAGYQWQLVDNMSDEFNKDGLDFSKWDDQIKTWKGRPPAQFLPENISVKSGNLQIKTSSHPNPSEKWTMAGASVAGKHEMTYGYFESRVKASKTRMSTTFWLTSNSLENKNIACDKQHAIELDILEAIGGWYDESWSTVVHSNTHYKPRKVEGGKCTGQPYLSKGIKKKTPFDFSNDYHVFSSWWRNPNEMTFYFDGESMGTVKLDHEKDSLAFDGPMALRMVAETYYWQTKIAPEGKPPYPTEIELDDPEINTAYYDYVRSYTLVSAPNNLINNGDFELKDMSWSIKGQQSRLSSQQEHSYTHNFGLAVYQGEYVSQTFTTSKNTSYQVSAQAKADSSTTSAVIQIVNHKGKLLGEASVESKDFSPVNLTFTTSTEEQVTLRILNNRGNVAYFDNLAVLKSQ